MADVLSGTSPYPYEQVRGGVMYYCIMITSIVYCNKVIYLVSNKLLEDITLKWNLDLTHGGKCNDERSPISPPSDTILYHNQLTN